MAGGMPLAFTQEDFLVYIDFECNFTDGFGCKFFLPKQPILQTLSICTAKAVCKITFKVYVNKLSLSVTLLGEGLRKRGVVKTLYRIQLLLLPGNQDQFY